MVGPPQSLQNTGQSPKNAVIRDLSFGSVPAKRTKIPNSGIYLVDTFRFFAGIYWHRCVGGHPINLCALSLAFSCLTANTFAWLIIDCSCCSRDLMLTSEKMLFFG